jgi:RNA polymerase sigma factor for flagellar operon FliA
MGDECRPTGTAIEDNRRLVVFVDDDLGYLAGVERSLAKHAGWVELILLTSSACALDYVFGRTADLFVVDAYMLEPSGIEVCRQLRARGTASRLALVGDRMTSAFEDSAHEAGANYALAKPIDVLALIATGSHTQKLDAQRRLIEQHLEVARNIAHRLARRYGWMLDSDDIDSAAMVGLCEAAARFDNTRVEPFIGFAEKRVRGAVLDEIRRVGMHGRVIHKRQRRISAAQRAILQMGGEPTDDRVAEHLGLELATVQHAAKRSSQVGSDELGALASPCASPQTHVECAQLLTSLSHARDVLPEPDATVIRLCYDAGMSLACVARSLGYSLGRVRHIHARGLAMLLASMRGDLADDEADALRESVTYSLLDEIEATNARR